MFNIRTDLALEAKEIYENDQKSTEIPGVKVKNKDLENCKVSIVEVIDEQGSKIMNKGIGKYVTLESNLMKFDDDESREEMITYLKDELVEIPVSYTHLDVYKRQTAYTGHSTTSTGTTPKWGTIAVDPSVIPYGTKVYIPQFGKTFIAEDCGSAIKGNKIDIYMNDEGAVKNWGRKTIDIYIVG